MKKRSLHWFKRTIPTPILALLFCLGSITTRAYARDYTTKFPEAEPLISEGGHWITAGTPGVNWHDTLSGGKGDQHVSSVSTTPGYAFGPTGSARFGDALALLTGTWNPDQTAQATVRQVSPSASGYPEVEIRLRTSPKDATGYEIMWSALGEVGNAYIALATWDGPGSKPPHYTFLKQLRGAEYGVATGDVVKGTIVGNTITAYKNGKQLFQITNNRFSTGNPGFGFNEGPNGTYGISSFTATDTISGNPSTISALLVTGTVGAATTPSPITPSTDPAICRKSGQRALASVSTTTNVIGGTSMATGISSVKGNASNTSGPGTTPMIPTDEPFHQELAP